MSLDSSDAPAVILVEDLILVRMMAHDVLEEAGFRVIDAANGDEALKVLEARADIRAVVADIELGAGLNGLDLARQISRDWPRVGIVLTSGRTIPDAGDLPAGAVFLSKPYSNEILVEQVRGVSDRGLPTVIEGTQEPIETSDPSKVVPLRPNSGGG